MFVLLVAVSWPLTMVNGQTARYDSGFETSADAADWVLENGTMANKWHIGGAAHSSGSRGLYISCDNGRTNTYANSTQGPVYAYHDFTWNGGECGIKYDWRCYAESYYDFARAFIVPQTQTFTAGVYPGNIRTSYDFAQELFLQQGWYEVATMRLLCGNADWSHEIKAVDLPRGNWRLVFMWANDTGSVFNPAAAIDNVSIGCPICLRPDNLRFRNITDDSCTVVWDNESHARSWVVEWADTDFAPMTGAANMVHTTASRCRIGGLSPNTKYWVHVTKVCDEGETSPSTQDTFTTCCQRLTRQDLPYVYGFEAGYTYSTYLPYTKHTCWNLFPISITTEMLRAADGTSTNALCLNGNQVAVMPIYEGDMSDLMLTFSVLNKNTQPACKLSVGLLSDREDASTYIPMQYVSIDKPRGWKEYNVALTGFPSHGYTLAIKNERGYGNLPIWLDDVKLSVAAQCPFVEDLKADTVSASSAYVTWKLSPGFADNSPSYRVTYTDTSGRHSITVNTTHVLLSGLEPSTRYNVEVQADCGQHQGDSATVEFRTKCPREEWSGVPGTDTTTSRMWEIPHSFSGNSVSQSIFQASTLTAMGLSEGYIDGCTFSWFDNGDAMEPICIYIDTTTMDAYRGAQSKRFLSVAAEHRCYSGVHVPNTRGVREYVFDEPFLWDGVSNIVLTTIMNTALYGSTSRRYNAVSCLASDTATILAVLPTAYYDSVPDTATRAFKRLPYTTFRTMCNEDDVCMAPLLTVDKVEANSVRLVWAPGFRETQWRLESKAVNGNWTTDIPSTTARSYTYNSLQPNTTYHFRLMGICADGSNMNYYDTVTVTIGCGKAPLPVANDFECCSGTRLINIPPCWQGHSTMRNSTEISTPHIHDMQVYGGTNAMYLSSTHETYSYLTLPIPDAPIDSLVLSFDLYWYDTLCSHELQVGVMDDASDYWSFTTVAEVTNNQTGTWTPVDVPLSPYTGNGKYITLMSPMWGSGYPVIDNVYLDYPASCPRPAGMRVSGISRTSVEVSWDGDSTEMLVYYGAQGFTLGTGRILSTYDSSAVIGGLSADTAYDFYFQRVCATGDSSRTVGPLRATPGQWVAKPNRDEYLTMCDGIIYDDGPSTGYYSNSQLTVLRITPEDTDHVLLVHGTFQGDGINDFLRVHSGLQPDSNNMLFSSTSGMSTDVGPFMSIDSTGGFTMIFYADTIYASTGFELHVQCMPKRGEACTPVRYPSVQTLTQTSATVVWRDTGLFQLSYKSENDTQWLDSMLVAASQYKFQRLERGCIYDWKVRRVCAVNTFSEWSYGRFATGSPCEKPDGISASNITETEATIDWNPSQNSSRWKVRIVGGGRVFDTIVSEHPVTVNTLRPGSTYMAMVKTVCTYYNSVFSDTAMFRTLGSGVEEASLASRFTEVMPNPATDQVTVISSFTINRIEVYTVAGTLVETIGLKANTGVIDTSRWPKGAYILRVRTSHGDTAKRLVVQ